MAAQDPWKRQLELLGSYIRSQRQLARLSLRELAELTKVSNPYLSQIERGLHEPSVRVLKSIGEALGIPGDLLLRHAGLLDDDDGAEGDGDENITERTIRCDDVLTDTQKQALIAVYRSYVAAAQAAGPVPM